eukprot:161770-Chlamydomonas_euryale.AAC.6
MAAMGGNPFPRDRRVICQPLLRTGISVHPSALSLSLSPCSSRRACVQLYLQPLIPQKRDAIVCDLTLHAAAAKNNVGGQELRGLGCGVLAAPVQTPSHSHGRSPHTATLWARSPHGPSPQPGVQTRDARLRSRAAPPSPKLAIPGC